ncbi:MAG: hypothetical protein K0Q59_887 [Paenibacillus sp.]|jgi:hypothetical protein|nr:hypothetical protein [Paenibacillus sp.]
MLLLLIESLSSKRRTGFFALSSLWQLKNPRILRTIFVQRYADLFLVEAQRREEGGSDRLSHIRYV